VRSYGSWRAFDQTTPGCDAISLIYNGWQQLPSLFCPNISGSTNQEERTVAEDVDDVDFADKNPISENQRLVSVISGLFLPERAATGCTCRRWGPSRIDARAQRLGIDDGDDAARPLSSS
jgi:hypothetical protein